MSEKKPKSPLRRHDIRMGEKAERTRIIAMLEDRWRGHVVCRCTVCAGVKYLIAELKEENE